MRKQRASVTSQLDAVETGNDVAALGTPAEREQWGTVGRVEEPLTAMPPGLDRDEARDKLRLIKGVLYWRLDASFKARVYQERRTLRQIDAALEELQNRWIRVQQARSTVPNDTDEFAARIAALAARVQVMRDRLSQTSQQQSQYLGAVAESELRAQKERLDAYALQARFALADIYDRGTDAGANTPGADVASPPSPEAK